MSEKRVITVTSKEAFKNAVSSGYDTIIVGGSFSHEIAGMLRKNETTGKLADLSAIIGLFFAPAFIATIVGELFTAKMRKYEIVNIENDIITIQKKEKKKKKK